MLSGGNAGAEQGPPRKKRERKKFTAAAHEDKQRHQTQQQTKRGCVEGTTALLGERVARRKTWHPPPRRGEKIYRKAQDP